MANGGILDKIIASQHAELATQTHPEEFLKRLVGRLRERERDVLTRRFGILTDNAEAQTLKEIGDILGVTRERVRQIESTAIERMRQLVRDDPFKTEIDTMKLVLRRMLEERGGVMEQTHFIELGIRTLLETLSEAERVRSRAAFLFLIEHLLSDVFEAISEGDELRSAWKLPTADYRVSLETIARAREVLEAHGEPMEFDKLVEAVVEKVGCHRDHCEAHLHLSAVFRPNAFGQWGVVHWSEVTPRRINDKIYLVLKRASEPLHFTEIARRINDAKFDDKSAHPATVHNELISDKRYVLVGRGMYALASWGYEPGVVSDVIVSVLGTEGKSVARDAIVEAVLRQRMVRKSTVLLALTDRSKFTRLPDGKYALAATNN